MWVFIMLVTAPVYLIMPIAFWLDMRRWIMRAEYNGEKVYFKTEDKYFMYGRQCDARDAFLKKKGIEVPFEEVKTIKVKRVF